LSPRSGDKDAPEHQLKRVGPAYAFWEDRYHATAIEAGNHLRRCLVHIDLNMVRAGVVKHPSEWAHSGPAGAPGIASARDGATGSAAGLRSGIEPCARRRSHQAALA
jgi:hypothetical protein